MKRIIALFLVFISPTAWATDIYVSTMGSDSTGTGTSINPYASPGKAGSVMAAGDTVYIASGTYLLSNNSTNTAGGPLGPPAAVAGAPSRVLGYYQTKGDLDSVNDFSNFPVLKWSASAQQAISANNYLIVKNFIFDGSNGMQSSVVGGVGGVVKNCRSFNMTQFGFNAGSNANKLFEHCLASACPTGFNTTGASGRFYNCVTIACSTGIAIAGVGGTVSHGLIYGSTGTVSGAINLGGEANTVIDSVIYGGSGSGIFMSTGTFGAVLIHNNIIANNGAYGIKISITNWSDYPSADHNFYRSNTSGNYLNLPAGASDVALSADPFVNAATGNFALNNAAGGGAAVRGAGYPGVFPGGLTTGYADGGAAQHQDSPSTKVSIFVQ